MDLKNLQFNHLLFTIQDIYDFFIYNLQFKCKKFIVKVLSKKNSQW